MINKCLIISIVFVLLILYNLQIASTLLSRAEGFVNPADYLVGKVPQYAVNYQKKDLPQTTDQEYKYTDSYYYPPFETDEPAKYEKIYQAKNFWPIYVEKGEDPDNRLAWVKDAPYYGDWKLPTLYECPERIENYNWITSLPPTPKPEVKPFGN